MQSRQRGPPAAATVVAWRRTVPHPRISRIGTYCVQYRVH